MPDQLAGMVECYQLDIGVAPWEDINVSQDDIDRCDGFDDYEDFRAGKITAPQQPNNSAYMAGWHRHEERWERYQDWRDYCK